MSVEALLEISLQPQRHNWLETRANDETAESRRRLPCCESGVKPLKKLLPE